MTEEIKERFQESKQFTLKPIPENKNGDKTMTPLKCFKEVVIVNPDHVRLHGLQSRINDYFDVFVTEVHWENLDFFHNINYGRNKLFIYIDSGEGTDIRRVDVHDKTKSIPNPATWFISIGLTSTEFTRKTCEFFMDDSSFDISKIIKEEDAACAKTNPEEFACP